MHSISFNPHSPWKLVSNFSALLFFFFPLKPGDSLLMATQYFTSSHVNEVSELHVQRSRQCWRSLRRSSSIDTGVPHSALYFTYRQCRYSYLPLWTDHVVSSSVAGRLLHFVVFFFICLALVYEKAWGKRTMLPALTHLTARRWGTGRGERIFHATLSLSVKTSGRLRLLWHTWWSAAPHMIMTAPDL